MKLITILYFHLDWTTTTWQWLFQTLLQVPIYNVMLNIRSSVCIIPLRYRLICIINIDFINFAKQSLSLLTSLFLSYTSSYTTDFYLLESYPWFAVPKTFMSIVLFTKMLDQRSIFLNRKRFIFNHSFSKPCCFIFLPLGL